MAAKTYPPIILDFFARGLNTNRQPLFSALTNVGFEVVRFKDYLIDGINVECSDQFTLQRAPGFIKYCSAQMAVGEKVKQFYSTRDLSGTIYPLADTNQNLYTVTPSALTSLLTKGTQDQGYIQQVGGVTYYSNGTDLKKWIPPATSMVPWGIAAPLSGPTLQNTLENIGFWNPRTAYVIGGSILDIFGNIQYETTAGISGISLPIWNPTLGGFTQDGSAKWQNVGPLESWTASTPYSIPTVVSDTNGNIQLVTSAGTSGSSIPSWNATLGATTTDSGVTWTNIGPAIVLAYSGWSYVYAFRTVSGNLSTASDASLGTGPIIRSVALSPITISGYTITSNVVSFAAEQNLSVGQGLILNGFPESTFFNGQAVKVLSSGLSTSAFEVDFTHADTMSSEMGQAFPVITTVSGEGTSNEECNSVATVTAVSVSENIVTLTCDNDFVPGLAIGLSTFVNATFLNGQVLFVETTDATPTTQATQFTARMVTPDYLLNTDAGTATFLSIEVYRNYDGGGIFYFDGAAENPGVSIPVPYDSGLLDAGLGTDDGVPGTYTWNNPNNVTDPTSYAVTDSITASSGTGRMTIVQSVQGDRSVSGGNLVISLANPVQSGNTLLLMVGSVNGVPGVSDNHSNTYTLVASNPGNGTNEGNYFYIVTTPTAAATTVTITNAHGTGALFFEVFGIVSASPVDASNGTGGVTTTNATDVILSSFFGHPTIGYVQSSGFTSMGTVIFFAVPSGPNCQVSAAYQNVSATGTYAPLWTRGVSTPSGITVALKLKELFSTDGLVASTFPFTVPLGDSIIGIEVKLDAKYTGTVTGPLITAQLINNGNLVGGIKTITPTTSNATYTLGSATDLWGTTNWSAADFSPSALWGVKFIASALTATGLTFSVRHVQAEVFGEFGVTRWQFNDIANDIDLDTELVAPLFHQNDPPPGSTGSLVPTGGTLVAWWSNRIWMASGNAVYFTGGPDVLNGIAEECWPPANVWVFPGEVTSLKATTGGLVIITPDEVWAMVGGPQTVAYYPERILQNFGALSDNCVKQDGDTVYVYNSQKQLVVLSGVGKQELGAAGSGVSPVGNLLANGTTTLSVTASAWSPETSHLAIHRQGEDSGVYLSNGVESIIRYGLNVGNFSPVRQPVVNGTAISGVINSVETSSGQYSLLMGPTTTHDYIYTRSLTTFADNGHAYASNAVIGNITVTEPGQLLAPLQFISAYLYNRGSVPSVSFFPNDITPSSFIALSTVQSEPAFLASPTSLMSKRWPVIMNQTGTPILLRHLQVKVNFGNTDTVKNELMELALRFDTEQMV